MTKHELADYADMATQARAEGRAEGRNAAFADMMKHAKAITLGASDKPTSVYNLFTKAIRDAAGGQIPTHPSLSFAERRAIAREFISEHGDKLFEDRRAEP